MLIKMFCANERKKRLHEHCSRTILKHRWDKTGQNRTKRPKFELKNMNTIITEIGFRLSKMGYSGLSGWAREQGYGDDLVRKAVYRWQDRQDGLPRGETAVILTKLSVLMGEPITPVLKPYFKAKRGKTKEVIEYA